MTTIDSASARQICPAGAPPSTTSSASNSTPNSASNLSNFHDHNRSSSSQLYNAPATATMNVLTTVLAPPLLLLCSIPLASFAFFTSTVAFSALLIRVLIVYVELGVVIAHDYFTSSGLAPPATTSSAKPSTPAHTHAGPISPADLQAPRRLSRPSSASVDLGQTGAAAFTPAPDPDTPSAGAVRDYEGVGGWRIAGPADEDAQWTLMNSRLELPAAPDRKLRHRRSRTGGSEPFAHANALCPRRPGDAAPACSPNNPRAKSPAHAAAPPASAPLTSWPQMQAQTQSHGSTTPTDSPAKDGLGLQLNASSSTVSSGSSGKGLQMGLTKSPSNQ